MPNKPNGEDKCQMTKPYQFYSSFYQQRLGYGLSLSVLQRAPFSLKSRELARRSLQDSQSSMKSCQRTLELLKVGLQLLKNGGTMSTERSETDNEQVA